MLNSLFSVVTDVAKIVTAPVEIALDTTRAITKPVAEVAETMVKEVEDLTTQ